MNPEEPVNRQQPNPRIIDRRRVEEYEDDAKWNVYEYPPAGELEPLEVALADTVFRWVLERYDVGEEARSDYARLLEMDEEELDTLSSIAEHSNTSSPATTNHNRLRYRAEVLQSARGTIIEEGEDVEAAVQFAVEEILDGELHLKYLAS